MVLFVEHAIRHARAADLKVIADIEDSGGPMFEEAFGDLTGDVLLSPAPSGGERLDEPGFLLVVGPVGEPFGFAHVEVVDGFAHLAQISVRPERMRQGYGSALVREAMREAWLLGFDRLSPDDLPRPALERPFYPPSGSRRRPAPSRSRSGRASSRSRSGWTGTVPDRDVRRPARHSYWRVN